MHLGAGSWGSVGIEPPLLPAGQVLSPAQMKQCWSELMEDALVECLTPVLAGHLSHSGGGSCLLSHVLPPLTWSSMSVAIQQHWVFWILMQLAMPDLLSGLS